MKDQKPLVIAVVVFLLVGAILLYAIPYLFNLVIEKAEKAAFVVSAVATAVSAYSASLSLRLKKEELERGKNAAKSIVISDFSELFGQANEAVESLGKFKGSNYQDWNLIVERLIKLSAKYQKRQDQVAFLAINFHSDEVFKIQEIYLKAQQMLDELVALKIEESPNLSEVPHRIKHKQTSINECLSDPAKRILNTYQALNFGDSRIEIRKFEPRHKSNSETSAA